MTVERKVSIKTWSAVAMLASGVLMAFVSLLLPPIGEINDKALWFTAQCFVYAGTIFQLKGWKSEIDEKLESVSK